MLNSVKPVSGKGGAINTGASQLCRGYANQNPLIPPAPSPKRGEGEQDPSPSPHPGSLSLPTSLKKLREFLANALDLALAP